MTKNELAQLRVVDMQQFDSAALKDITDVFVDTKLPIPERIDRFIEEVGNPYLFCVKNMVVRVCFGDAGITLQQRLERVLGGET